jgi:hypothetical protein
LHQGYANFHEKAHFVKADMARKLNVAELAYGKGEVLGPAPPSDPVAPDAALPYYWTGCQSGERSSPGALVSCLTSVPSAFMM